MTLLIDAIRSHAPSFDDTTYPTDIYFHLLKRVREATLAPELGVALTHVLAWKDGKVRRDQTGPHVADMNRRYTIARARPNAINERHEAVLKSEAFFKWASPIRNARHFDSGLIDAFVDQFPLWKTVVLPVFVMHCLRPPIYPIVDRYVIVAFNVLQPSTTTRFNPSRITVDAYDAYHRWWLQVLKEAEIPQLNAELNELKDLDAGIWALGKAMVQQAKELSSSEEKDLKHAEVNQPTSKSDGRRSVGNAAAAGPPLGTDSREFKARAVELWLGGKTQGDAIKTAAEEMAITLKASYAAYPGSHFDRWRKQGFLGQKEVAPGHGTRPRYRA